MDVFASNNANQIDFFADALWWQMRESNATNWGQILYPDSTNETITYLHVPFKNSPGLRAGVGLSGHDNPWSIFLYYTGYQTRGTSQASTDTGQIHSAFSSAFYANNPQGNGITGPYYHQAAIQWNLNYNTIDLELGRLINLSKLIDFRPFIGLRSGIINQSMDSQWSNPPPGQGNIIPTFTNATERIENNFKGIGPSLGLDATFHLYSSATAAFNLIGNVSGAFLVSHWTFGDHYQNNTPQSISTVSDSLSSATSMVKEYIGLEWSFSHKNANWNINIGYEEQVWFNQLQYYSFDMGKTNDTLYLSGLVFGVGVKI